MRVLAGAWLLLRRVALVLVLVAIVLGVGDRTASRRPSAPAPPLDVLVAIDRTTSMSALDDPAGSRLAAAVRDVDALAEAVPSARFSVVVFGAAAQTVVPFTTDRDALRLALAAIVAEAPTDGAGSSLDRPVPLLGALLGGTDQRDAPPTDRPRALVVASDGERTAAGGSTSYEALDPLLDGGVVLGYGTTQGGRMPLVADDPGGADRLVIDPATGAPALSRLDEGALRDVAAQIGGVYLHRTEAGGLGPAVAALRSGARADPGARVGPGERHVGWLWALLLLVLALPELRRGWRRWLEARREARA